MTALADSFFALAALASLVAVAMTLVQFGPAARDLRRQLQACNETIPLSWKVIERPARPGNARVVTMDPAALRPARPLRPAPRPLELAA